MKNELYAEKTMKTTKDSGKESQIVTKRDERSTPAPKVEVKKRERKSL
jgi:hypothetical protein